MWLDGLERAYPENHMKVACQKARVLLSEHAEVPDWFVVDIIEYFPFSKKLKDRLIRSRFRELVPAYWRNLYWKIPQRKYFITLRVRCIVILNVTLFLWMSVISGFFLEINAGAFGPPDLLN